MDSYDRCRSSSMSICSSPDEADAPRLSRRSSRPDEVNDVRPRTYADRARGSREERSHRDRYHPYESGRERSHLPGRRDSFGFQRGRCHPYESGRERSSRPLDRRERSDDRRIDTEVKGHLVIPSRLAHRVKVRTNCDVDADEDSSRRTTRAPIAHRSAKSPKRGSSGLGHSTVS